jgi:predicted O-linked N-acetylglucosamine transferase (SPINDLY family)
VHDIRRAIQEASDLAARGRADRAVASLLRVVQKHPGESDAARALAQTLLRAGQHERALFYAQRAVALAPTAQTLMVLSAVYHVRRDQTAAADAAVRAAAAAPESFEAQSNLGVCLQGIGDFEGAERAMRRAIEVNPGIDAGHANLANFLVSACRVEEALGVLREGLRRCHGSAVLQRALCYTLNYLGQPAELVEAQKEMGRLMPARPMGPHRNSREPQRPLRVGFVSPDFQRHVVMRFFEPLLEHLDRAAFVPLCYSTSPVSDEVTQRVRANAAGWVEAWGLDDRTLAERIAADRIDVLVDLAGFTTGARPEVFCLCPAPVQVAMIGYPGATGLPAIIHRIADAISDPPGQPTTDTPMRLGRCFLCYRPPADAPPVAPVRKGPVVFALFNAAQKISPACLVMWGQLLQRVPGSRMVLKSLQFASAAAQEAVRRRLPHPERFEILGPSPTEAGHLAAYAGVDIALDTYPYCGTTTTCEALWMGVPVVTLAGGSHAARVGTSLLTGTGLPELVAETPDQYVEIAMELSMDRARLDALRSGLRERVEASPLRDERGYGREVGAAFRALWGAWCARDPITGSPEQSG